MSQEAPLSHEKQVALIRSTIAETCAETYQFPQSIADKMSDSLQGAMEWILRAVQIETLEWVLRELLKVTP